MENLNRLEKKTQSYAPHSGARSLRYIKIHNIEIMKPGGLDKPLFSRMELLINRITLAFYKKVVYKKVLLDWPKP